MERGLNLEDMGVEDEDEEEDEEEEQEEEAGVEAEAGREGEGQPGAEAEAEAEAAELAASQEEEISEREGEDEDDRAHRTRRTFSQRERRACGALTVQEERHALLAKAHAALAAKFRQEHLGQKAPGLERAQQARQVYDKLWEELCGDLEESSFWATLDYKLMDVALSVPDLHGDPQLIARVSEAWPEALGHVSDEILGNRDIMMTVVKKNGCALEYASENLRNDKELVLAAVSSSSWALQDASPCLRGDREVVLTALQQQTVEDAHDVENMFLYAQEPLRADRELALEAVRAEGSAVALASEDLRQDKEFVLQAMRKAPRRQKLATYHKADPIVRQQVTKEEFRGAATSMLAARGDSAPVLSVRLVSEPLVHNRRIKSKTRGATITSAEVTLLSGASFSCSLSTEASDQAGEPAPKRARSASSSEVAAGRTDPEQRHSCSNVGQLAKLLLAEMPRHMEVTPPPERVFVVFTKSSTDSEAVSFPVTPWDWNRPLSDFI